MDSRKKGGDIQTLALRPSGPHPFGRRDRTYNGAVHVEQQRAEGPFKEGALAHDEVGTATVALKQLGGSAECAANAHFEGDGETFSGYR